MRSVFGLLFLIIFVLGSQLLASQILTAKGF